jgi:DNA-binding transcriptional LysR family regulator
MAINFALLDLRAFLAVFDFGNFHKAATSLNMSQPALSRRLRTLESRLGTALFERSTRNVTPTSIGRQFEPISRRLLEEMDSSILSIDALRSRQSDQLIISSIPSAAISVLPNIIKQFNKKHPLIRLRIMDRSPQEALECVVRGEAEFGITMIGAMTADVAFTPFLEDPYVLMCHRSHSLAKSKNLNWSDLTDYPLIGVGRGISGNRALLEAALKKANVKLDWFYEVYNLTTAVGLVEAGLGAAVLPRLATLHAHHAVIVTKPIGSPEVTRTLGIVERRNGQLSLRAKLFLEELMQSVPGHQELRRGASFVLR